VSLDAGELPLDHEGEGIEERGEPIALERAQRPATASMVDRHSGAGSRRMR
jgi:hypothetical protein